MKTTFPLVAEKNKPTVFVLKINGTKPELKPYISIESMDMEIFVEDKQMERLGVNILKAVKSRRLK